MYRRLLEKLEENPDHALGGKVYDVLGELFEGQALRDLLVDAEVATAMAVPKSRLFRKVDDAVDVAAIERLVANIRLTSEGMGPDDPEKWSVPKLDGCNCVGSSGVGLRVRDQIVRQRPRSRNNRLSRASPCQRIASDRGC